MRKFVPVMEYNSTFLLQFLYQWRKPLLALPLVAGLLGVVASSSWFIKPLYKSSVIVFPATTNSVSKVLLPQTSFSEDDMLAFGAEEQAEQLIQILNSDEIFDTIAVKFNLLKHYDLDPTGKYKMTYLREEFNDKISFQRTQFMSVEIQVLDTDPKMAADIANEIVDMLDRVKSRIQRNRAGFGFKIVKGEYDKVRDDVLEMDAELRNLRKKGVHDYEQQSAVISEQLATAILEEKDKKIVRELQNMLDTLARYGGRYVALRDELYLLKQEEVKIRTKLDQARVDAEQSMPATFRVTKAIPAERKTYPVRWLIVAVSMFSAFVGTMLFILVANAIKDLRLKEA
jgi:capsular polysaccharide biosynthesis protein